MCAYCQERPAISRDHVVPKYLVKKGSEFRAKRRKALGAELLQTVGACNECNWLKGTRKLIPPSWEDKIPALKTAIPGHWRVWHGYHPGERHEDAYKGVYV